MNNYEKNKIKKTITSYLQETFNEVKDIWKTQIEELIFIYDVIADLKQDIKLHGLFTIDRYGQKKMNPSIEQLNKLYPKLFAVITDLNLSPKQFAKYKDKLTDEDKELDEYLENLVK